VNIILLPAQNLHLLGTDGSNQYHCSIQPKPGKIICQFEPVPLGPIQLFNGEWIDATKDIRKIWT
jgi:hypothetical protein